MARCRALLASHCGDTNDLFGKFVLRHLDDLWRQFDSKYLATSERGGGDRCGSIRRRHEKETLRFGGIVDVGLRRCAVSVILFVERPGVVETD
jgi:hypothetical protein